MCFSGTRSFSNYVCKEQREVGSGMGDTDDPQAGIEIMLGSDPGRQ